MILLHKSVVRMNKMKSERDVNFQYFVVLYLLPINNSKKNRSDIKMLKKNPMYLWKGFKDTEW